MGIFNHDILAFGPKMVPAYPFIRSTLFKTHYLLKKPLDIGRIWPGQLRQLFQIQLFKINFVHIQLGFPSGHKIELIQKGFFRRGQTNSPLHGKTKEKSRGYLSEFDVMALDRIFPGFSSRGKG